jgi:Uma2 family endonuclease
MAIASAPSVGNPSVEEQPVLPERRRFSIEEYHRMGEAGILGREERVELIDGEIVVMSPIGNRHMGCVDILTELLVQGLVPRAIVRVQGSVRLMNRSEPQPDIALLRRRADFYTTAPATADEVLTLIEVIDTSAAYDRGFKRDFYARSGIAELWLVDLNLEQVEVYRKPSARGYKEARIAARGESVSPEAFPDFVLGVDAILGEGNR